MSRTKETRTLLVPKEDFSPGRYNETLIYKTLYNPREPDRTHELELTPDEARELIKFLERAIAYKPPNYNGRHNG